MKNPKSSDSARVQACNAILDRGWGKPAQYVETANVNMTIDDILNQVSLKDYKEVVDVTKVDDENKDDPFAAKSKV